jgi:hypothetical protein
VVGRGYNRENHIYIEKIFFSKTSKPFSIKLGTNHPLVKARVEIKFFYGTTG